MKNSLKKQQEYEKVYNAKKSFATKNLVMYVLKNCDMEFNRLGISVSRKVGNSVVRHRLTRQIREIFYKNRNNIKKSYDIIIVLRVGAKNVEFFSLNEQFIFLCKKHDILIENNG